MTIEHIIGGYPVIWSFSPTPESKTFTFSYVIDEGYCQDMMCNNCPLFSGDTLDMSCQEYALSLCKDDGIFDEYPELLI